MEWAPSECSQKNKLRENCFTGIPRRVHSQAPASPGWLVLTKRSVRWGPRGALAPGTLSESQITITTAASFPSTLLPHFTDEQNDTQDVPKRTGFPGPWFVPGLDVGHLSPGPLLGPLSFPAGLNGPPLSFPAGNWRSVAAANSPFRGMDNPSLGLLLLFHSH